MRVLKLVVPPDKSISHRAVMLASISEGVTRIKNLLMADDIRRTIEAFRSMGVRIDIVADTNDILVKGVGLRGLKNPHKYIYLGNSGTTMRILPGILAGQDFCAVLKGDSSLSKRPMMRVVKPLRKMGVKIYPLGGTKTKEIYPPLKICGGRLKSIRYNSNVPSAQVKSSILFAGLFAEGPTLVTEPVKSRDHTERMLRIFGVKVSFKGTTVSISNSGKPLQSPGRVDIPGDISSAAFFIVAGCILPNLRIVIRNVGLNPTRIGILDILKRMGANIRIEFRKPGSRNNKYKGFEPVGDIVVNSIALRGVRISPKEVVKAIDEIPIIMVAACFAEGKTVIEGVDELRVKETDRIKSMLTNLRKIGADVSVSLYQRERLRGEKIIIRGGRPLSGGRVSSYGDHRTAMSMLIAGLAIKGRLTLTGYKCINKSFPDFENMLRILR